MASLSEFGNLFPVVTCVHHQMMTLVVIISVTIRGRPHIFGEAESALALASLVLKTVWYLGAALVNSFSPTFRCPGLGCLVA